GSMLTARASGGSGAFALQLRHGEEVLPVQEQAVAERGRQDALAQQFAVTLDHDAEAVLLDDGDVARSWAFAVIPDQPPQIRFIKDPRQALNGTLELSYALEDDYGVASAMAEFKLAEPAAKGARPLYGPPD